MQLGPTTDAKKEYAVFGKELYEEFYIAPYYQDLKKKTGQPLPKPEYKSIQSSGKTMEHHPEHTWGHTLQFGEEYYQKATSLLRKTHDDAEMIAGVAQKAAAALRSGGKVYTDAAVGHMPPAEMADDREGNPAQIHSCGHGCSEEDYAALASGDVLITKHVSSAVRQARDAGVYVVGLPTAYVNNNTTPPGKVPPNENDWLLEDVSSVVLETHIPWNQGIVQVPQVPEMPVFPVSSTLTCSIHWMLTAEVARALASGDQPDGTAGREYLDILFERLDASVDLTEFFEQGLQAIGA